jgi:hypothetical protein
MLFKHQTENKTAQENIKERVMKTLAALIGTMAPATAFAAANVPAANDGIFVWIFLGFFALVVVGQLIPAIMLIVGLVKGITTKNEAKTEAR